MEENFKIIATTFKGLEQTLAEEVRELGGQRPKTLVRAVSFYGDMGFLYKANLKLSTALRILRPIAHLRNIKSVAVLYNKIYDIPWEEYFDADKTVFFHVSGRLDGIPHTHFVSQKVKDALVDRFRDRTGRRPRVDNREAQIHINLHMFRDQMSVALDSSGDPLFKRGYRKATGKAPLNEVLAAGLIRLAGWKGDRHLIDPMCGSGTIPIEAALQAMQVPPGIFRESFSFMHWKDFDAELYEHIRQAMLKRVREPFEMIKILGYDKDGRMIDKARMNAEAAGVDDFVRFEQKDFFRTEKIPGPVTLIFNPPYDQRLSLRDKEDFFRRVAAHLKEHYRWSTVWILSDIPLGRYFGRRPFRTYKLVNGKIDVFFSGFNIE
ncbi:MAG: class I SAM-dependent RNA methyltransferase [Chlorobi bacterium]|nr:class I SAM-dependent RNA methyltransferase [Chlorobiota bacterium]